MPSARHRGRVFVGAGYCGHGMPSCSGVGKSLAEQMAAAEGHDVSRSTAADTPAIRSYLESLSPIRFIDELSGDMQPAAAAAAVSAGAVRVGGDGGAAAKSD